MCKHRQNHIYDSRTDEDLDHVGRIIGILYKSMYWGSSRSRGDIGHKFMVPARIRPVQADGNLCLPDKVRIHFGRAKTVIQIYHTNDQ